MSAVKKIDILTRVEGHGSVELIRVGGQVVDARLNLHESPRLFEALVVGRRFDEIADIACRICSICSTVHKVAALQAVEQAMGVAVSRQTGLLRELAVQGGQIESHALHFADISIRSAVKARAIELQQAMERAEILIGQLLADGLKKELPSMAVPVQGEGTSLVEAPRGVLLHGYRFDGRGICRAADIITPTAINQGAMAVSLKGLIVAMEGADYEQIRTSAEILIRCFDPCISCAVH